MNDTGPNPYPQETADFFRHWNDNLAQVLSIIAAGPCACELLRERPTEAEFADASDLWMVAVFSGALRGEMGLRVPKSSGVALAQIFLSEPADPGQELKPDHREGMLELFRQAAGLVATGLRTNAGELQLRIESLDSAPSWPASATTCIRASRESAPIAWIELQISAALAATLRKEASSPEQAAPASPVGKVAAAGNVNLDLLMDVELALTLRFGSRRLLLREVLDLSPGSVVELDRQVQDPVDVLLDGRIIARGEVVVWDGNYGVRVTQISDGVSPL